MLTSDLPALTARHRRVHRIESDLQRAGMDWLRRLPHSKVVNYHGSAFTEKGIPDTLLVWYGLAVWFEWKIGGCVPDPMQLLQHRRFRHAGSPAFVCTSVEQARDSIAILIAERRVVTDDGRPAWLIPTPSET